MANLVVKYLGGIFSGGQLREENRGLDLVKNWQFLQVRLILIAYVGHPIIGSSFKSYVIENIINIFPRWDAYFYRDSTGNEVDLVLGKGIEKIAIEIKSSTAPKVEKGFWNSMKFLKPGEKWCIAQVDVKYPGGDGLWITNLELFLKEKINEM